jgi:ribosomal protein L7/L12
MFNGLTEEQISQILEELQAGRKLSAIKMCRQMSGGTLVAAKDYVENLASGKRVSSVEIGSELGPQMDDILDAIEGGNKLAAVKLYRESRGVSLMEAKEFIETLMDELEPVPPVTSQSRNGCGGAILMAILSGLVVVLIAAI